MVNFNSFLRKKSFKVFPEETGVDHSCRLFLANPHQTPLESKINDRGQDIFISIFFRVNGLNDFVCVVAFGQGQLD